MKKNAIGCDVFYKIIQRFKNDQIYICLSEWSINT